MIATLSSPALRVFVIEPQRLLGKALCTLLAGGEGIEIAGDAAVLDADALASARPDVIIVSYDGGGERLRATVSACRTAVQGARVLVLGTQASPPAMIRSLSCGADGYAVKDATPQELTLCVHNLAKDGFYADPRLAESVLRERASHDITQLSRRELEVVGFIVEGLSNKEISAELHLSEKTVKNHVANIFSKLHLTARTQVAVFAIRNGIV